MKGFQGILKIFKKLQEIVKDFKILIIFKGILNDFKKVSSD